MMNKTNKQLSLLQLDKKNSRIYGRFTLKWLIYTGLLMVLCSSAYGFDLFDIPEDCITHYERYKSSCDTFKFKLKHVQGRPWLSEYDIEQIRDRGGNNHGCKWCDAETKARYKVFSACLDEGRAVIIPMPPINYSLSTGDPHIMCVK